MRVLFVALAIVGYALAQGFYEPDVPAFPQNPIESQPVGIQLGTFPWLWCHTYCTLEGTYDFQRYWAEPDPDFVGDTHIFDWSADGGVEFWDSDCHDVIEYYRYLPIVLDDNDLLYSESRLRNCIPTWIYIENVEITYDRFVGRFHWTHRINDAFQPTEDAWSEWSSIAFDAKRGNNIDPDDDYDEYDAFDGLLRYYPEPLTSRITSQFENDYYYRETYVGNYEPNYCTMKMSHMYVNKELWCKGQLFDDSDDSDNIDFPTRWYCIEREAWYEEDDNYEFGCDDATDDCDAVDFDQNTRSARLPKRTTPSKTDRLKQATRSSKNLAKYEKRGDLYDLFYSQNAVAGAQFPYCAIRD
uniref:Uncharacterized protein n=1 Tax=Paramoeba aestuarina TaxID=180227 RepID=A0A7S4NCE8_9EUKA